MKITGCIVTYNNEDTIENCIGTILKLTEGVNFKLYVFDNCSTDKTVERIKSKYKNVNVTVNDKNDGFGYGHNQILKKINSDYHFIINPDIYFKEDVITPLAKYLSLHESVGLITPKVLNLDGTEQFLPKKNPTIKYVILSKLPGLKKFRREYTRQDEEFTEPTEMIFCTGCFFGARTKYLKEIKGFDKSYYMYFEDADISRRVIEDGKKIIFYPEVAVFHDWHRDNMGSPKGVFRFLSSMVKYFNKWGWR